MIDVKKEEEDIKGTIKILVETLPRQKHEWKRRKSTKRKASL